MKLFFAGLLLCTLGTQTAWGFGHKKMDLSEVTGLTETQVAHSAEKLSVMVRGRAAELLFRTLKEKRSEKLGSEALEMIGALENSHWTVEGKQVACSRIKNEKKKQEDYACAFDLAADGEVMANAEPFNPSLFNLVKTKTQARLFPKKKAGRGLASVAGPAPAPYAAKAYAMFKSKNSDNKPEFEDALIVFRGQPATDIMDFLAGKSSSTAFQLAGLKGWKGKEISCVESKGVEPARCALVVGLADGGVSTRKNPLFK